MSWASVQNCQRSALSVLKQLHNYMTLRPECHGRTLRDRPEIHLPKVKSTICQSAFKFTGAKDWDELPNELRIDGLTLGSFKRKTFEYLQEQDKTQHKCTLLIISFWFFNTFFMVNISLSAFLLRTIVFSFYSSNILLLHIGLYQLFF